MTSQPDAVAAGPAVAAGQALPARIHEPVLTLVAPLVLLALAAALGLFIPGFLDAALRRAALFLGA